jgi:CheY-like chemotaxis protein
MAKIFIIDDEEPVVRLLVEYFSHFDYECIGYTFDHELIESIRSSRPDIIISDMNLHNTNGLKIIAEIKQNVDLAHIPFIFLTGSVDDQMIQKGFEIGADDCLRKPLDLSEIKLRLEHVLKRRDFSNDTHINILAISQSDGRIAVIEEICEESKCNFYSCKCIKEAAGIVRDKNINIILADTIFKDGNVLNFYDTPLMDFSHIYFTLFLNSKESEIMKKSREKGINDFIYINYGENYFKGKLRQIIHENSITVIKQMLNQKNADVF